MSNKTPKILVFAGPNGSGKSTVTTGFQTIGDYINADDIKCKEACDDLQAAKIATALREYFLSQNKSFSFETVLSTDRNLDLLKRARAAGYDIFMIYVLTRDVSINVDRVRARVKKGGHSVPEEKIKSRYDKSIQNLSIALKFVTGAKIIDNSGEISELIIEIENGRAVFHETEYWNINKLQTLIKGNQN